MFLTQEKLIKKIDQDRQRGDLKRAQRRALDGLERWPDDYELAVEAIQTCLDLADFHQAVALLKTAIRRHPRNINRTLDLALEAFFATHNPCLGSFIIEMLLRSRNIERVRTFLKRSPKPFLQDLIKRSETRSKGGTGVDGTVVSAKADNDLLLGLLFIEDEQYGKAIEPLGMSMEDTPENAKEIGSILLEFERDLKNDAMLKFYLGLASVLLSHPDKAEARFFQCLELDDPPLEKLQNLLESIERPSENHMLLNGEVLIRRGEIVEGTSSIAKYFSLAGLACTDESTPEGMEKPLNCTQMMELAYHRLSLLLEDFATRPEVVMIFAECAAALGKAKRAVESLEALFYHDEKLCTEMIPWIENREDIAMSAPAQKLLMRLNLAECNLEKAAQAARMAADMDPTLIPCMLGMIEEWDGITQETHPLLMVIIAELRARAGDTESAEEILQKIRDDHLFEADELARLTGEVLRHGGVTLNGVLSIIEFSMETGNVSHALPFLIEFYRDHPDAHGTLAARIRGHAEQAESRWSVVAGLVDALSEQERLTPGFMFLQAYAHLETGTIERAVFEFDQLLMLDGEIRYDLLRIYEHTADRFGDNTTLHLALYHLYLEDGQLADAAHHLCRTLELDPGQIRDVLARFNDLVKKEPHNRGIWEEMLKSALSMNHFDLARETLKKAIEALPDQEAASLHVYGARLSSASGNVEDTLRSLAVALTSSKADLPSIEWELNEIITRDPANPDALYLLGETLFMIGREDEGVSAFEHCLSLSPTYRNNIQKRLKKLLPISARPWLVSIILGGIAWKDGRHDDALKLFRNAQNGPADHLPQLGRTLEGLIDETPDDRRLKVIYARNLSLEKRFRDAVSFLEQLLAHDTGLTKFAVDILLELIASEPSQLEANHLLARTMIQTGQIQKSLEPILRLLSPGAGPAATIDEIVSEYVHVHENNAAFLVAYAGLKARCDEHETSICLYRRALEIEPERWEEIVGELRPRSWPEGRAASCMLLVVDCLIAGERYGEAFDVIRKTSGTGTGAVEETVDRIDVISQHNPEREQFTLAGSLLLGAGSIDRAEQMIDRGRGLLDGHEFEQLRIEFAELLHIHGHTERAASIFRELLDASPDREAFLKRIESTFEAWASKEIAAGILRVENGVTSREETERYIRVALDHGNPGAALGMLAGGLLPEAPRAAFAARAYLQMERPLLALAVLGAIRRMDIPHEDLAAELSYLEGIASEQIGDYGRATAAFSKILATARHYRDCHERVAVNYTKFLQSTVTDDIAILEKTGAISPPSRKGEDGS